MIGTGFMISHILPPKSRGNTALSLTRHEWGDVHYWLAYALSGLVLLHLWAHRKWLVNVAAKKNKWKIVLGILPGILIIIAPFFIPTEQ